MYLNDACEFILRRFPTLTDGGLPVMCNCENDLRVPFLNVCKNGSEIGIVCKGCFAATWLIDHVVLAHSFRKDLKI